MLPTVPARFCVLTGLGLGLLLSVPAAATPGAVAQGFSDAYSKLPLSFEPNEGQVDKAVRFLCRGYGYTLFLTSTEAVLSLRGPQHEAAFVRLQVTGGNARPRVVGESPLSTRSSYFLGNDPAGWHTGIQSYARVRVEDAYPGIDLIYRGSQRQLEYDFVVAPHADPGRIRLAFHGADPITIGAQGELILHTAAGELVQPAPVVYQVAGGKRQRVESRYVLLSPPAGGGTGHQVSFQLGSYDRSRRLIIDPILLYSTFLGGSDDDQGPGVTLAGIAVDAAGNAYVTGQTVSATFPGVSGASIQPVPGGSLDAFVTKINAEGTAIVYSTFLGGGGPDSGSRIAVDGAGNAYVTGVTSSTTFPGVNGTSIQPAHSGGIYDAFAIKIDPTGTAIVYSTFLGGSEADSGDGIVVDGTGNAYITGFTSSATFPGVGGSSIQPVKGEGADAFVTKIDAGGMAIVYSTFLGGSGDGAGVGSGDDGGLGIAVDGAGSVYIVGQTLSTTFPGVSGSSIQPAKAAGQDAFVTKIDAKGTAIVYSTFLGGNGADQGFGIAVDGAGSAYVAGTTTSTTFPVTTGAMQTSNASGIDGADAFVTKINSGGTVLVYSTFLGGSGFDSGQGIAVDGVGNAYVTGYTASSTLPGIGESSIQPANGGGEDTFLAEINPAGTATVYSTFLGGSGNDRGLAVAVDGGADAYVVGFTASTDFPGAASSSIQPMYGGGGADAFVAKIGNAGSFPSIPTVDPRGLGVLALLLAALGLLAVMKATEAH